MKLRVALAAMMLAVPLGAALPSRAATVNITISNFRYCQRAQCLPTDTVYVRNPTGNGLINHNALAATLLFRTAVHPGDTVVWTYADSFCDAISGCPGHEVCFENGTPGGDCGSPLRFAPARSGAKTITFTVPLTAKPRTLLRYFCNINDHWAFGMTGTLLVV